MGRYSPTVLPGQGVPDWGDILGGAADSFSSAADRALQRRRQEKADARQAEQDALALHQAGGRRGTKPTGPGRKYIGPGAPEFEAPAAIEQLPGLEAGTEEFLPGLDTRMGPSRPTPGTPEWTAGGLRGLREGGLQIPGRDTPPAAFVPGAFVPGAGFVATDPSESFIDVPVDPNRFTQVTDDIFIDEEATPQAKADRRADTRLQESRRYAEGQQAETRRYNRQTEIDREARAEERRRADRDRVDAEERTQAEAIGDVRNLNADQVRALAEGASMQDLGIETPAQALASRREARMLADYETEKQRGDMVGYARNYYRGTRGGVRRLLESGMFVDILKAQFPDATQADVSYAIDQATSSVRAEELSQRSTESLIGAREANEMADFDEFASNYRRQKPTASDEEIVDAFLAAKASGGR
jgi:hypothetical protein